MAEFICLDREVEKLLGDSRRFLKFVEKRAEGDERAGSVIRALQDVCWDLQVLLDTIQRQAREGTFPEYVSQGRKEYGRLLTKFLRNKDSGKNMVAVIQSDREPMVPIVQGRASKSRSRSRSRKGSSFARPT